MIKAVVFDIDGTLTDMKRRLDPLAVEVFEKLRMLEVPAILATGNVHCFTRAAVIMLGTPHVFISENGGLVSYADGDIELLADLSLCEEAYQRLKEVYPLERHDSRYRMTDLVLKRNFNVEEAISRIQEWGLPVDLLDSTFAVHITDRRVDKGKGLLKILDHLQLNKDEVAAVGDSISDLPLFHVAGFSAAVANALPDIKEAVDFVSPSKFGKGAYEIVEYMIEQDMF